MALVVTRARQRAVVSDIRPGAYLCTRTFLWYVRDARGGDVLVEDCSADLDDDAEWLTPRRFLSVNGPVWIVKSAEVPATSPDEN